MWQIVDQVIAGVMFPSGDILEYRVNEEQLADAEAKLVEREGILRWQPDFGSRDARPEIIVVEHIARLRAFTRKDTTDALVMLWYRRDDGRLYLGDPDDDRHLQRVDGLTVPTGDSWSDPRRDFATEAHDLIAGEVDLDDLGVTTVGRPRPIEADMILAATVGHGGSRLEATPGDLAQLDDAGRAYLGSLLPESLRPTEVIPQRQRAQVEA